MVYIFIPHVDVCKNEVFDILERASCRTSSIKNVPGKLC